MARYRTRHSVPGELIDGPVIVIGDPTHNRYLQLMDRAMVAQRSLGQDNVGPGRAVIAWVPRAFSPQHDCVVVAASDQAGVAAAIETLAGLARTNPGEDSYYAAREATRFAWSPSEVVEHKQRRGLLVNAEPLNQAQGAAQEVIANQNWAGLTDALGTAIFSIDASEGGVAVGTKSWARPTGLLSPDGEIRGFWGGDAEVTPRDVAVSANGRHAFAGYSLLGRVAAYGPQGKRFVHNSPIVFSSNNPYGWDTFKDSDRQLGISPDHQTAIAIAASDEGGIIAYDANSGSERWRIARAGTGSRPRGGGHPGCLLAGQFAGFTQHPDRGCADYHRGHCHPAPLGCRTPQIQQARYLPARIHHTGNSSA